VPQLLPSDSMHTVGFKVSNGLRLKFNSIGIAFARAQSILFPSFGSEGAMNLKGAGKNGSLLVMSACQGR
jgi:hypothetical protein